MSIFQSRKVRFSLLIAILAVPTLLAGCSNSKLLISPIYNRLDDRIRDEFNKLGDFSDEQVHAFEQRLGTYHVWHRQSELPQYATLLREIAASIKTPNNTSKQQVAQWTEAVSHHSTELRECHPINFSLELMQSLTDDEVNFIQRRFIGERTKNRLKYAKRTPEERVEQRLKSMTKWAKRADFVFTSEQKILLQETLQNQISMRKQYYKLSDRWNQKLFALARQQESPTYKQEMQAHLNSLWTLMKDAHGDELEANRELWKAFGYDLVNSMTDEQRVKAPAWLAGLADTLETLSTYKPSFKATNDPALGCLVNDA